jgi:hypothetical protein
VQLSHGTVIEQLANGSHTGYEQALGGMISAADALPLLCTLHSHARLWPRNEKREKRLLLLLLLRRSKLGDALEAPKALM